MAAPEKLFCTMLEAQYTALRSSIEALIGLPAFALARLKSNFQRLDSVIYQAIEAAVEVLIDQLIEILKLDQIDQNETKLAFCRIARDCAVLTDILFDEQSSPLLAFMTPEQIQQAEQNYDDFELYVCKIGLVDLIDSWTDQALDEIERKLDELEDRLLGAAGLDELIRKYQQAVEDSGVLELLDQFDKFAQCAFAICNFVATSDNSKEEYEEKLSMTKQGDSWVFVLNDAIQSVYDKDDEITQKINGARNKISKWKQERSRDYDKGYPPDQVAG